jgi:hypothetical protein
MKLMENHKLNPIFEYVCVDGKDINTLNANYGFSCVPAIVSKTTEGKQIVNEGGNAFNWVKNFLINRRQIQNTEQSRKLIQRDVFKQKLSEKLFEFCPNEQNGISDPYALCKEDANIAMPKTYIQYEKNNQQSDNLMAIPIGDLSSYKKREGLDATYRGNLDNVLKQLDDVRDKQEKALKTVMEREAFDKIAISIQQEQ